MASSAHGTSEGVAAVADVTLKSYDILADPVLFIKAQSPAGYNGNSVSKYSAKPLLFDVIDTSRPPEAPSQWFHPPGAFGDFVWTDSNAPAGRGLDNLGNTCFLNATLQCLAYCPPLTQDALAGRHSQRCLRKARQEHCGFCEFEKHTASLFDSRSSSSAKSLANKSGCLPFGNSKHQMGRSATLGSSFLRLLTKEVKLNQGDIRGRWFGLQNCAHEWLVQFLDWLTKYDLPPELQQDFQRNKIPLSDLSTSYLHQLFCGLFRESKTCETCGKSSVVYEPSTCIRVPMPTSGSLDDALRSTFAPEVLSGSNKPLCDNCGVHRKKVSQRSIYRPPNILVIMIQRSEFHRQSSSSNGMRFGNNYLQMLTNASPLTKNKKALHVPFTLNVSEYLSEGHDTADSARGQSGQSVFQDDGQYEFFASVNHHGSASFGHYWSIVRGPNGFYYRVDDSRVEPIGADKAAHHLHSAYLVFYIRRSPVIAHSRDAASPVKLYASPLSSSVAGQAVSDANAAMRQKPAFLNSLSKLQPNAKLGAALIQHPSKGDGGASHASSSQWSKASFAKSTGEGNKENSVKVRSGQSVVAVSVVDSDDSDTESKAKEAGGGGGRGNSSSGGLIVGTNGEASGLRSSSSLVEPLRLELCVNVNAKKRRRKPDISAASMLHLEASVGRVRDSCSGERVEGTDDGSASEIYVHADADSSIVEECVQRLSKRRIVVRMNSAASLEGSTLRRVGFGFSRRLNRALRLSRALRLGAREEQESLIVNGPSSISLEPAAASNSLKPVVRGDLGITRGSVNSVAQRAAKGASPKDHSFIDKVVGSPSNANKENVPCDGAVSGSKVVSPTAVQLPLREGWKDDGVWAEAARVSDMSSDSTRASSDEGSSTRISDRSSAERRGKLLVTPFQPMARIEQSRSAKGQFGCRVAGGLGWEDDGLADSTTLDNEVASIQRHLLPKSGKRSRDDFEYDKGKVKKVKALKAGVGGGASFNFAAVDKLIATRRIVLPT